MTEFCGIYSTRCRILPGLLFIVLFCLSFTLSAQSIEALQAELKKLETNNGYFKDTVYLNKAIQLGFLLAESNPDSALSFLSLQLEFCQKVNFKKGEAEILKIYGNAWQNKGDFKTSILYYKRALEIAENIDGERIIPGILNNIGLVYAAQGNNVEALNTYFEALKGAERIGNNFVQSAVLNNIAAIYFEQGKLDDAEQNFMKALTLDSLDSANGNTRRMILAYNNIGDVKLKQEKPGEALGFLNKGYTSALQMNSPDLIEMTARTLASIYSKLDSNQKAAEFFHQSISIAKESGYGVPHTQSLIGLAALLQKEGRNKEALGYAKAALALADTMGQTIQLRNVHELLTNLYEADGNIKASLNSSRLFKKYSDMINSLQSKKIAANHEAEYEMSVKTMQFEKESIRQQWLIFSGFASFFSIGIILFITARNRYKLNVAYNKLQERTTELGNKNEMLENTLHELKKTQMQLVHAEKMASLGELTAAIAHEIQNPLNFVNNFSEVNNELIDEMQSEIKSGNNDEAINISNSIKGNQDKIIFHGKRADAIVKGMLQHSQLSTNKKEATDINALADEYLRFSYQGLRAKDKSFNVTLKTDFDETIGTTNIIPQDIGRVLLNLYNNAFYAVNEKQKAESVKQETQSIKYEPRVTVSTKKVGDKSVSLRMEIKVTDNGNGIPQKIVDKIFQPFFTTKPTGQGTGLGLSLSYDVIKAHGGEIKVETKEGEGSKFIIELPLV